MKKFIYLIFAYFIIITNANAIQSAKGTVIIKYNINNLLGNKYKFHKDDKITSGMLEINSKQEVNLLESLYFRSNLIFRVANERTYNGNYPNSAGGTHTNHKLDDFYGKENYILNKFYFRDYTLIAEELVFEYKEDAFLFGLGKFNPLFGVAYDDSKLIGINGNLFAQTYQLKEKLGTYIGINGEVFKLIFSSFFDDTTFLSSDLFNIRGIDNSKGGAGNTKKLNNFSLISEFNFDNTKINLGFRRLAVKLKNEKPEKGYIFGIQKYFEETDFTLGFNPLFEIAYLDNYDGIANKNVLVGTIRLPIIYKGWNLVFSHSNKYDREKNYNNYLTYLSEISLGYKFRNGLILSVAKKWHKEAFKISNISTNKKQTQKFNSVNLSLFYSYDY